MSLHLLPLDLDDTFRQDFQAYLDQLHTPLDGMWEQGLIAPAAHWRLSWRGEDTGFAVINEERCLLLWYLRPAFLPEGEAILAALVREARLRVAYVSTGDPGVLGLLLRTQRRLRIHTYLFAPHQPVDISPAIDGPLRWEEAAMAGLPSAVQFCHRHTGSATQWLEQYLRRLIERRELFFLYQKNELLVTGECRLSDSQPAFADLGMIVARAYRRRSLGAYMLLRLRARAEEQGRTPICSCEATNTASYFAIKKAGFVSRYQILALTL
jgi:GNAT superfamily N-acetyltransferase